MASTASKRSKTLDVPLDSIHPSIENDEIYGAIDPSDIDLVNLAIDIAENGIREPIHVSKDWYVLSGHRRLAASKLAKLNHATVSRIPINRSDYTSDEWKKKLVAYNLQRVKSSSVRLKEVLVNIDPDIAYRQLIQDRQERDEKAPPKIKITGTKTRSMEAKETSSNYKKFFAKYGENSVYELEAVAPSIMQSAIESGIKSTIDLDMFNKEVEQEKRDAALLQAIKSSMKDSFASMLENGHGGTS